MSELRASTISDAAGTGPVTLTGQSAAKSWAVITGSGTFTLHDSFNVSSSSDAGTGRYLVNVSSAFVNINYAPATADGVGTLNVWDQFIGLSRVPFRSTSQWSLNTSTHISGVSTGGEEDKTRVSGAIFGDLA